MDVTNTSRENHFFASLPLQRCNASCIKSISPYSHCKPMKCLIRPFCVGGYSKFSSAIWTYLTWFGAIWTYLRVTECKKDVSGRYVLFALKLCAIWTYLQDMSGNLSQHLTTFLKVWPQEQQDWQLITYLTNCLSTILKLWCFNMAWCSYVHIALIISAL